MASSVTGTKTDIVWVHQRRAKIGDLLFYLKLENPSFIDSFWVHAARQLESPEWSTYYQVIGLSTGVNSGVRVSLTRLDSEISSDYAALDIRNVTSHCQSLIMFST